MGAYTEIVDFTFTANETSRTFSGLSITKDDFIKLVFTGVNNTSSTNGIALFPNTTANVSGFNNNTNYHVQGLQGDGSSVTAFRSNGNLFSQITGSQTNASISFAKISENGKWNIFTSNNRATTSSTRQQFAYTTSSNLTFNDPVTSLTITSNQTNGIGTGSRIQIYRLDAVKEADITVTSNTTQVDISNLSIDKDSEYLLVSDVLNASSNDGEAFLSVNDITTQTNYFRQQIRGDGSNAQALRANTSRFVFIPANGNVMSYSHIKLSNIGAYTHQTYGIFKYGTSTVEITNVFSSSTAENITSITKLNIIASTSNTIGTGSRFTLYKLYE